MVTTAAPSRTRIASLAVRARNIVDSVLCTQTSAVPDWLVRLDHLEHLAAIPAPTRPALLAGLDDDIVCDLMVLSYLRTGTTYALWTDSPGGFAQDVLRALDAAAAVLVMNLIGGWVFTWLVMRAYPGLHPTAAAAGAHFVDGGYTLGTFCLAVLGGGVITLMTRMHHGTESMTGKIIASIATAFVLAGLGLWHSGPGLPGRVRRPAHRPDALRLRRWLGWLGWAVLGNVVGGLLLTTALRLVRSAPMLTNAAPPAARAGHPDA